MQATDKQPSNHYQIHDQQSDPWLAIWLLLDEANLFGDGHTTTSKGSLNNECCSCLLPVAPYSTFGLDEIVPMTSKLLPEYCCSLNIPAKSANIASHASSYLFCGVVKPDIEILKNTCQVWGQLEGFDH